MKNNSKRQITITLLLIWISYMIFRGILKLFNLGKVELNKQIFGTFAIVNYWIDALILLGFIAILILFIKRKWNTWRYIIGMTLFLILGTLFGQVLAFVMADKFISVVGEDLPRVFFLASSI